MFTLFGSFISRHFANSVSSDDITVEVIFFGQGPDSRTVEINREASASEQAPKAKL